MKILLTGVTGYIGKRLLSVLVEGGHEVYCCARDPRRFDDEMYPEDQVKTVVVDFLKEDTLQNIPEEIDVAYYLIHSMSTSTGDFQELEKKCAENFSRRISDTAVKQVIYLSGIVNEEELSPHLKSRLSVESVLSEGDFHLTTLRAGIIIGSGSASFEIMRDLVEKLPVMIAPRWVSTRCQPIAIRNVLQFLSSVKLDKRTYDGSFDIGGPEILTYKEMLLGLGKERGLNRHIISVPVMTPKLSSYWLYFVTSTTYKLAINLVDSMKIEVICEENELPQWYDIDLIPYSKAVELAFDKIDQQEVVSSWTDAMSQDSLKSGIGRFVQVPTHGCMKDEKVIQLSDEEKTVENIWSVGGDKGWFYGQWLWEIRGFLDKIVGGVGLRRGRTNPHKIKAGQALDFWRVIYASRKERRLLLYAEMKMPGEAWLEFEVKDDKLYQTATFRPLGLLGRAYWYALFPFHYFIFQGMAQRIAE